MKDVTRSAAVTEPPVYTKVFGNQSIANFVW